MNREEFDRLKMAPEAKLVLEWLCRQCVSGVKPYTSRDVAAALNMYPATAASAGGFLRRAQPKPFLVPGPSADVLVLNADHPCRQAFAPAVVVVPEKEKPAAKREAQPMVDVVNVVSAPWKGKKP